jgi:hypothetical protein
LGRRSLALWNMDDKFHQALEKRFHSFQRFRFSRMYPPPPPPAALVMM